MSEHTACGCQRIYYQPLDLEDGHFRERWRCIECKSEFVRATNIAALEAKLKGRPSAEQFAIVLEDRDKAEAKLSKMEEALKWYGEKAEAMRRYGEAKPPKTTAMTAVITELSLDGGSRSKALAGGDGA